VVLGPYPLSPGILRFWGRGLGPRGERETIRDIKGAGKKLPSRGSREYLRAMAGLSANQVRRNTRKSREDIRERAQKRALLKIKTS
jgi:hypothetical protein